jgi:hypothetical protein
MAKHLPSAMRSVAAGRTNAALNRLFEAMAAAEDRARTSAYDVPRITMKAICEEACVGEKFLFGPKHKNTTRKEIEGRVAKVNMLIEARVNATAKSDVQDTPLGKAKAEALYWKERYERLARHGHLWFVRMRDQQRIIRDLRQGTHSATIERK